MQNNILGIMNSIIPITRFNRGEAARIFDEVAADGTKLVLKNNAPACVLISPREYARIAEALEDYELLQTAIQRADCDKTIPQEELLNELGISAEEIAAAGDVELE